MRALQKIIFSLSRLTVVIYLALALLWFYALDHKETLSYARGSTLSRIMPPFDYFVDYANGEVKFDKEKWEPYKFYFEKASRMMPLRADVYGLLGYTYYQLGKKLQAEEALIKGVKLLPHYFWYRYNLGVVYYQQGKYAEAAEAFNSGLGSGLEETVNYIYQARMYFPILLELPDHQKRVIVGTQNAFNSLYLFMIQCYLKLNDYQHLLGVSVYAINQNVKNPAIFYYYAGFAQYQLKDYVQALVYLDECVKRNPNFSEAYYYLSLAMKESGNAPLARVFLQKSVDMYQKYGSGLANIEEQMVLKLFW